MKPKNLDDALMIVSGPEQETQDAPAKKKEGGPRENVQDDTGFYSLSQLASCRETEKQRARVGVFPLSKKQILRLVDAGNFPAPVGRIGGQSIWRKVDIRAFAKTLCRGGSIEGGVR